MKYVISKHHTEPAQVPYVRKTLDYSLTAFGLHSLTAQVRIFIIVHLRLESW